MLKPICVACQRFYRPQRNGIYFVEGMPIGQNVPPGTAAPEQWEPYKLWCGDRWQCEGCGHLIIVGTGRGPVRERHQRDFAAMIESTSATFQVNDC